MQCLFHDTKKVMRSQRGNTEGTLISHCFQTIVSSYIKGAKIDNTRGSETQLGLKQHTKEGSYK